MLLGVTREESRRIGSPGVESGTKALVSHHDRKSSNILKSIG